MKPVRLLIIVAALLLVLFLGANIWVGGGSNAQVVEVANARLVQDGYPAKEMMVMSFSGHAGFFGYGERAEVEFRRLTILDGKEREPLWLMVELERPMNLMKWRVISVKQVTPTGPLLPEQAPTTKPEHGTVTPGPITRP